MCSVKSGRRNINSAEQSNRTTSLIFSKVWNDGLSDLLSKNPNRVQCLYKYPALFLDLMSVKLVVQQRWNSPMCNRIAQGWALYAKMQFQWDYEVRWPFPNTLPRQEFLSKWRQFSSKWNLPETTCMMDLSYGTSCTVFTPWVTSLNKDSLLSPRSFASLYGLYHSFFSNALHARETPWSLAKIVQHSQGDLWYNIFFLVGCSSHFCFSKEFTLIKVMWISAVRIPDWQSHATCLRSVLPFRIHDNSVLNPYSAYRFFIPGLIGFACYTDKTLVVAPGKERKKIIQNRIMNPYQSFTQVYIHIGVWQNWKNSIKTNVEKRWLAILTARNCYYRDTCQQD